MPERERCGRPPKYRSREEIEALIEQYFKDCKGRILKDRDGTPILDKAGRPVILDRHPPTVTGLALALGFTNRLSLLSYQGKAEFQTAITRAKSRVEQYAEERLFDRDGVNLDTAHLLEVGELRNLHAVQPDLPAKPPGAERRALPVVLDEADVVICRVDSNSLKRVEVELLGVHRRGLDEHLELIVVLQAVGVLAVAAVSGTAARLRIAGAPSAGAERAERRGGMEGAGADLRVIGLHDDATLGAPVLLELQNDVLEGECRCVHTPLSSLLRRVQNIGYGSRRPPLRGPDEANS